MRSRRIPTQPLGMWWHQRSARHHTARVSFVTVPMFDASGKGVLWVCSCGRTWAQ